MKHRTSKWDKLFYRVFQIVHTWEVFLGDEMITYIRLPRMISHTIIIICFVVLHCVREICTRLEAADPLRYCITQSDVAFAVQHRLPKVRGGCKGDPLCVV